jgi:hypothetical protein
MKKFLLNLTIFVSFLSLSMLVILMTYKQLLTFELNNTFFTGISALATVVAAVGGLILLTVTIRTFTLTKQQIKVQEEPIVTLRLMPDSKSSNLLTFHIKNTGGGPAYDLNIKLTPDLPYGKSTINNLPMFKRMPLLEKGEEISFLFDSYINYSKSNNPKQVNAKTTYYTLPSGSRTSKKLVREFEISLDEREGQMQIIKKDLSEVVKELEELKHALIITNLKSGEKND